MAGMIAYCGIDCRKCPRFRMTRLADRTGRRGLARWLMRVLSRGRITGEPSCDGCTAIDARMVPTGLECPARCCAMEHGVRTCADCDRFGCDRLAFVWKRTMFRDAEPRLRRMHAARTAGR
ncbi:MAG: DUF3795 domain-containing protein [bacterium]